MPDPIPAVVISPRLPEPPVTGGQKRTLRLLEAMASAGLTPHVLTEDRAAAPEDVERLRERGWRVELLPEPPPGLVARARQHLRRLPSPHLRRTAARLAELAPGAALVQLEHTQSAYYEAPGVPRVLSLHNIDSEAVPRDGIRERYRAAALRHVERRAIPRADRVLAVSEHDASVVRALGGHAILAPNGVDDELFAIATPPPRNERVLFFGHFGYGPNARGIERFAAHGWPELLRRRPTARLVLAGAGMTPALRAKLPGAEILGLVDDLPAALAAAAAVVVPIWEGGGTRLKVLEALAAGRPVVSTPLGAAGIGFEPGVHGLLAETPQGLAAALDAALTDPIDGRALARRFRWVETLSGASAYYAELAGSWNPPVRRYR